MPTHSTAIGHAPAQFLQAALAAQSAGDLASARRDYLKAAQMLLAEARRSSSPQVRRRRQDQANQIMRRADEIAALLERRKQQQDAARRQTTAPVAAEEPVPDWLLAERPSLRLDDVAGLDDVKQQIRLKLVLPFAHPEEAARFGIRPGGGILLYGPPGTGKTYIARAVAGELEAAFFVAKASNLMSQWFGKAEQNVAALFEAARREERAVIFLDEVEALVPRRSTSSSSVMPRVISEFLAQTQSLNAGREGAVLLMGATNEPWAIDPAALRPGRFDELIYVGLPDDAARLRMLELNLSQRPLAADVELETLAQALAGYSGADIAYVCTKASERAFLDAVESGEDRIIVWSDFAAVLGERRPSVTAEQVRKYEAFRNK